MDPRLWLLAGAQFAAATGAHAVTGMLGPLAAELGVSLASAGQLTAAYALTDAVLGGLLALGAALACRIGLPALPSTDRGGMGSARRVPCWRPPCRWRCAPSSEGRDYQRRTGPQSRCTKPSRR